MINEDLIAWLTGEKERLEHEVMQLRAIVTNAEFKGRAHVFDPKLYLFRRYEPADYQPHVIPS